MGKPQSAGKPEKASGRVEPFNLRRLGTIGSPYVACPALSDYVATRAELLSRAAAVFELAARGVLTENITGRYPLAAAAEAQQRLSGRSGTGKLILLRQRDTSTPVAAGATEATTDRS